MQSNAKLNFCKRKIRISLFRHGNLKQYKGIHTRSPFFLGDLKRLKPKACLRFFVCFLCVFQMRPDSAFAQAIKVTIVANENGFKLKRNDSTFYVKGGGGQVQLDKLKEIGGNSIRTWSTDNAKVFLNEANKRGLTVMMGLWLGHERHGFDYDDSVAVKRQFIHFRNVVEELKDYPALLMWGIGNEVDLFYTNHRVWNAVQDIAAMIHQIDPNHPTSTVTAGLDSQEVRLIKQNCPDIDIYCVNTYGDLDSAVSNIRKFGWHGPYMITEWGPNGHWEVPKTPWKAPLEQNSTDKANTYMQRYQKIQSDTLNCLGSYIFLWGQKQETTATWYGVFDEKGRSTEALDIMHRFWKGTETKNSCPVLNKTGIFVDGELLPFAYLKQNQKYSAIASFTDKDNDKLKWKWTLLPESSFTKAGGDAELVPEALPIRMKLDGPNVVFNTKNLNGPYRLFFACYDGNDHVGYGNIPFFVQPGAMEKGSVHLKNRSLIHGYE